MLNLCLLSFPLGALLGTLGDFFHVLAGADGYANPLLPLPTGQPIWVPFLFGGATFSITLSHLLTHSLLPRKIPQRHWSFYLAGIAFFLALYAASGFLPLETGGMKDVVLWASCLAFWFLADRSWQGLATGISIALVGTSVEIFLTQIGAFFYYPSFNNLRGVPSWLPSLYVTASIAVGNFAHFLRARLRA